MSGLEDIIADSVFSGPYPFVRDIYEEWFGDGEGTYKTETPTWRPGVRHELRGPEDTEPVADGIGEIVLHVVSIHKPGRYPTRIFYLRQWKSPDGDLFGSGALRIATVEKFRRLARGYGYEFSVKEPA